jgi:hypothetical protein
MNVQAWFSCNYNANEPAAARLMCSKKNYPFYKAVRQYVLGDGGCGLEYGTMICASTRMTCPPNNPWCFVGSAARRPHRH